MLPRACSRLTYRQRVDLNLVDSKPEDKLVSFRRVRVLVLEVDVFDGDVGGGYELEPALQAAHRIINQDERNP